MAQRIVRDLRLVYEIVATLCRYLWAAPNSVLGALLAAAALMTGGRGKLVNGVLEVEGGCVVAVLRHAPLVRGGVSAMTLGHVVLGRDCGCLERTRAHERVHVRQCERWGPLFLPAYLVAGLWAWSRGQHYYYDNAFEREARDRSAC